MLLFVPAQPIQPKQNTGLTRDKPKVDNEPVGWALVGYHRLQLGLAYPERKIIFHGLSLGRPST